MKTPAAAKTWEKTKVQYVVRHKSGRYYARLFQNGEEMWKSVKTDHLSIAQARLAGLLKEHCGRKGKQIDSANAKMTFADAAERLLIPSSGIQRTDGGHSGIPRISRRENHG